MTAHAPRIDADVLRRAVSLLDLMRAGAALKRVGRDAYLTLCCFHAEDRPSMRVTLFKGVWRFRCFPCGANGDAIDFVMLTTGLSFQDALTKLTEGRDIDLTVNTPTKRRRPAWLLVCDSRGCTASLEVEDSAVVYLKDRCDWWVMRNRAYCGRCTRELMGRPEATWKPSDATRAAVDEMLVRGIQLASYGSDSLRAGVERGVVVKKHDGKGNTRPSEIQL